MWERDEGREGLSWFSEFLSHACWGVRVTCPGRGAFSPVALVFQLSGGGEGGPRSAKACEPLAGLDPSPTPRRVPAAREATPDTPSTRPGAGAGSSGGGGSMA